MPSETPLPQAPGRWEQGAAEIETLVEQRELERVIASPEHANLLIAQAAAHLTSAGSLIGHHPPSAFTLIYDAARKAMTAVLAKQGLRPTTKGGHRVVQDAIEAQLGPNVRRVIRPFRDMRTRRNQSEYPTLGDAPVTEPETQQAYDDASKIIERMRQFLPMVGPFHPTTPTSTARRVTG